MASAPIVEPVAVIEARVRQQFPPPQYDNIGGVNVPMSPERYEQWIADQVAALRAQQLEAYAEWQRAELRRLLKDSMEALNADIALYDSGGTINTTTQRAMNRRLTFAVYNLVQVLVDRGLIEAADAG